MHRGDVVWDRTYGASLFSVQPTMDGAYAVAGETPGNQGDAYLAKIDSTGETVWSKTYGGAAQDIAWGVDVAQDGGYVIAGQTKSSGAGGDVYLVKIDADGNSVWKQTFGGAQLDNAYSVFATTDGGYLLGGYTDVGGWGYGHVLKTDAEGNVLGLFSDGFESDNTLGWTATADGT